MGKCVRCLIAVALALATIRGGVVLAGHVTQVDPAAVPTGFLAAHSTVSDFPVDAFARATKPDGADVFVQHVRLGPGSATSWHTHPGPVIVTVVSGSLTHEYAEKGICQQRGYAAAAGTSVAFVDQGSGHVHRAIAGSAGVDFYAVYILPRGSQTHVAGAPAPEECV